MGAQPIFTTSSASTEIVVADDFLVQRRRRSALLVCTGMRRDLKEERGSEGHANICSPALRWSPIGVTPNLDTVVGLAVALCQHSGYLVFALANRREIAIPIDSRPTRPISGNSLAVFGRLLGRLAAGGGTMKTSAISTSSSLGF